MAQPTSKHHAEWLSLLEISGPFLSMPVLTATFPQGLDELEDGQARSLRADYEYWKENQNDPAVHTAWIYLVLESLLGYSNEVLLLGQAISAGWKADFPEHEETLRPDMMLADASTRKPRLMIQVYPPSQSLEKPVQGSRWQASVATRMMELLHATEIRLGLVTNGEQWMLVNAPRGDTTGFTTWYAGLWFDEPVTLRAFKSLLYVQRFFGVGDDQILESLLTASANDQQEITDQLGLQVRHAVEILVQMIDRADQDSGGQLLGKDVSPALLYETALTVMMRLVFMLSAEERKLLPLDDGLYAENYAVSTLRAQLRELADQQGEEVLERRFDAWSRLLAAFRAVYGGIRHDRLNLPPYGGSLFDPDKYPFLEGRVQAGEKGKKKEIPLPVNNRTVLHLLDALQILQVEGEARRLSFRALDVEQIGHVYEGLLDHIAVRATGPVLGLKGAKRQEPEIALSALEQAAGKKESDFLTWLNDNTGRSLSALKNAVTSDILQKDPDFTNRLRAACGNDERLFGRISPFAGLARTDDFGFPVVIQEGSIYVTTGTTRRATGTFYTPRSLTEPIVQHTLEPLVYIGPAKGLPREDWRLRSPQELLDLKICDMAMGSAGFLVQVVRYLAERLVEAWAMDNGRWTIDGNDDLRSIVNSLSSDDDRLIYARRLVAERCVYGVDKNPLAVEIAKLSLWLVTVAKDLPFTFLDHALKCGDSLVGASEEDFLRWAHSNKASTMTLFDDQLRMQLDMARAKRRELESFVVRDVQDAVRKKELLKEAEAAMAHVRRGADLLTGAYLLGLKAQGIEDLQINLLLPYMAGELDSEIDLAKHPDAIRTLRAAQMECAFQWEFTFPEVFEKGGFNAFVGNPPFLGGTKISTYYGENYAEFLKKAYPSFTGNADLCALFFLRTFQFKTRKGTLGLIATKTIAQGNTSESGLGEILKKGGVIYIANTSTNWPGSAAVIVSIVHISDDTYTGKIVLNEKNVLRISHLLSESVLEWKSKPLLENNGISYNGSKLDGIGFVIDPDEVDALIKKNPNNKNVLFPFLGGADLNNQPDQRPTRWVVNFSEWPLEKAEEYPDCLFIIRERVFPSRQNHGEKRTRDNWWQFTRVRNEMYESLSGLHKVIVISQATKYIQPSLIETGIIFDQALIIFASESYALFAVLNSSIHSSWALKYQTSLGATPYYIPTKAFLPFPFPINLLGLEQIGEAYHMTRRQIMLVRQEGLTTTYNRFHNPTENDVAIVSLRELHVKIDSVVAAAYGWHDFDLGHNFHGTALGTRYTISESARREVLSRLLKMNKERWEEEQKSSSGDVKKSVKGAKKTKVRSQNEGQMGLI